MNIAVEQVQYFSWKILGGRSFHAVNSLSPCAFGGRGGQGYPVDPDPAVVGYRRIFDEVGQKGSRYYIVESDSGIGNATSDPGRSLRHAKISIANMLALRGGYTGRGQSDVSDGAEYGHTHDDGHEHEG
jgi:hypothetical protein